jgi:alkyl hydroperoxide reductase subunit AhpC
MTSKEKQKDGKYSALNKEKVTINSSDGSSSTQFTKQTDKENGKQKFKQYNVIRDKDGNATMQIDVKTNRGADRTRVITNPKKIERKMKRVLNRNEM